MLVLLEICWNGCWNMNKKMRPKNNKNHKRLECSVSVWIEHAFVIKFIYFVCGNVSVLHKTQLLGVLIKYFIFQTWVDPCARIPCEWLLYSFTLKSNQLSLSVWREQNSFDLRLFTSFGVQNRQKNTISGATRLNYF